MYSQRVRLSTGSRTQTGRCVYAVTPLAPPREPPEPPVTAPSGATPSRRATSPAPQHPRSGERRTPSSQRIRALARFRLAQYATPGDRPDVAFCCLHARGLGCSPCAFRVVATGEPLRDRWRVLAPSPRTQHARPRYSASIVGRRQSRPLSVPVFAPSAAFPGMPRRSISAAGDRQNVEFWRVRTQSPSRAERSFSQVFAPPRPRQRHVERFREGYPLTSSVSPPEIGRTRRRAAQPGSFRYTSRRCATRTTSTRSTWSRTS